MTALTVTALKKFHRSPKVRAAIAAVKTARAEAARIRAHVESYAAPAFLAFEPFTRELSARDPKKGQRIMECKDLYLAGPEQDEQCARWDAECDRLHAVNGYEGLKDGQCPALIAEYAATKAENALLVLIEDLLGSGPINLLDLRKKALDLFLNPPTVG